MNINNSPISHSMSRYHFILLLLFSWQFASAQIQSINGNISTAEGLPLENVLVHQTPDGPIYTDANGNFEIPNPTAEVLTITPFSNSWPLNGVTTLDIVVLQQHLSGAQPLTNPYTIIAGEVNGNALLDTVDETDMENVILHIYDEFPNGVPSWRFVDAAYVFPDNTDPFGAAFPQSIAADGSVFINFIGIKTGDLNNSALNDVGINPCDLGCATIYGSVVHDLEGDCMTDGSEAELKNWIVQLSNADTTYYSVTNANGEYEFIVSPGEYTVATSPINDLWGLCANSAAVTLALGEETVIDFVAYANIDCHFLSADLGTNFLRRCFDNYYSVHYCNNGTTAAEDATTTVTFDPLFTVQNSSVPWSSQSGNSYTFDIGDLAVGECGQINITALLSCDAELGQTICNQVEIFPITNCISPDLWDGANLEVTASCQNDQVQFEILNTGSDMLASQSYIVIEDDMIMMIDQSGDLQLNAQESKSITVPANGATWRVEVNQTENHPLSQIISAAIEGCGENSNGESSQGMINAFPQFNASPAMTEDCEEVIGSWDPNDKAAKPTGAQSENFIEANTPIEYTIRFQNTGTDTAFTVVIKDELSKELNIQTVRPGASSHNYIFDINGENELEFTFPMIMLPDSSVNQAGSNGFVKFTVAQRADVAIGTVIENTAGIFFDFNEAVITNTVFHTIGEEFLTITNATAAPGYAQVNVRLAPQPMTNMAQLTLEGIELQAPDFTLYDLQGRALRQQRFEGNSLIISKNELTSGLYLFKIVDEGNLISSGKIIVQ